MRHSKQWHLVVPPSRNNSGSTLELQHQAIPLSQQGAGESPVDRATWIPSSLLRLCSLQSVPADIPCGQLLLCFHPQSVTRSAKTHMAVTSVINSSHPAGSSSRARGFIFRLGSVNQGTVAMVNSSAFPPLSGPGSSLPKRQLVPPFRI